MSSLFEVLAVEDAEEQERVTGTRAVIAVQSRVKDRFNNFLKNARGSDDEYQARLALVDSEIRKIALDVCNEYIFADSEKVYLAATAVLGGGHASDCSCGFCANKGNLPGSKKDDDGDGDDKSDSKDDSGDGKSEDKDDDSGKPWEKDSKVSKCPKCDSEVVDDDGQGKKVSCSSCDWSGGYADASEKTAAGAEVEDGDHYQSERVDVGSGPDASPKIDKGKVPADGLKPIDVDSVRNRSEQQDASAGADYDKKDFDPDSPIRERIDADKALQPEHNVGEGTSTWTGTEGQAAPVTSHVLAKWSVLS